MPEITSKPLLEIKEVSKQFALNRGLSEVVRRKKARFVLALAGVSLTVRRGETIVLLGESGSGKTTLGRLIVGLDSPTTGEITLDGRKVSGQRESRSLRGKLQMVFQDPSASLDPFMNVHDCIAEPLSKLDLDKTEVSKRVSEAMQLVSLESSIMRRRTSELSGGQKQRVAIARSIVSKPDVVVLDEPTSSIDVSIQAQVLNLLVSLQELEKFTYLLITHDPNVARFMADTIAVMYLGKIVEYAPAEALLANPKHPYTKALLSSAPKLTEMTLPTQIKGEPPSLIYIPKGCRYNPRCPFVMEKCKIVEPLLCSDGSDKNEVACFLYHDVSPSEDVKGR